MINQHPAWKYALIAVALPVVASVRAPRPDPPAAPVPGRPMINQHPAWKYALIAAALPVVVEFALPDPTLPPHPFPDIR